MNSTLKAILIILNIAILLLALIWQFSDFNLEPVIVIVSQSISLIVIGFEKQISNLSVKSVSNSKVDISTSKEDTSNIDVRNIKDKSKIKIKKN